LKKLKPGKKKGEEQAEEEEGALAEDLGALQVQGTEGEPAS
jgi:hypothetical protein